MAIKIARVQTDDRILNQIQQNIAGVVEPIFYDLSGQFVGILSGCTTQPSGVIYWQRPTSSGPVTLTIPTLSGTSNVSTATIAGLPPALWPMLTQNFLFRVTNSGTTAVGILQITPGGDLILQRTPDGGTFATSGIKGVLSCSVTYMMSA